jgi:hypothetical protein
MGTQIQSIVLSQQAAAASATALVDDCCSRAITENDTAIITAAMAAITIAFMIVD